MLAQGNDIVPIPGTKRRKYLEENVAASELSLTPVQVKALGAVFSPDTVAGDRYPAATMGMVNR